MKNASKKVSLAGTEKSRGQLEQIANISGKKKYIILEEIIQREYDRVVLKKEK